MKSNGSVVRWGITEDMPYQLKRQVLCANYFSLILCGAIILLIVLRALLFQKAPYEVNWELAVVMFALPLLFNRFRMNVPARLILSTAPVVFIWYAFSTAIREMETVEISMYDGIRIYLLAGSFIPYLIFDKKHWPVLLLGIAPTLLSVIFFESIAMSLGIPFQLEELYSTDYQLMPMRSFVAYAIVSSGCYTFMNIINRGDETNERLIRELENQAEEIRAQNDELILKQQRLDEINQHLEELVNAKTRDIQKQNEVLMRYSWTNAHKVRGPVARILGLIQVSRLQTELDYPWFFEKVESEASQIDEIISHISEDLNSLEEIRT